ncbi:MAG: M48 family metalloprotease, partial [Gaiellaceae bacterium]
MTATRIVRPATLAAAAGVAAWLVAALFLWRTKVPSDLTVPSFAEQKVFGPRVVAAGVRFDRFFELEWLLATLTSLAVLCVFVRRGPKFVRSLRLGPVNAGIVTAVVIAVVLWAVSLPFEFAGAWWSRRHGILQDSWAEIVFSPLGGLYGEVFATTLVLALVLLLAKRLPRGWWLATSAVLLTLTVALQLGLPYLQRLGTHPVRSPRLAAEIRTLERREHAGDPIVRVEPVKDETSAANAYAFGIGPSRSVFIWDTMLDGRFSGREVRFVLAHELGHLARWHIWKGIAWGALVGLPLLALVAFVTGRRGGLRRAENVPLALLTLAVAGVAVMPFVNAVSRRYEAEADWMALNATHDPTAARGLFRGFVETDLQNPDPPGWVHVFLEDHPSA